MRDLATARLRKRVLAGKIVLAPQAEIEKLDPELIDDFLDQIFAASGALVTDETRLSDFVSCGGDPQEAAEAVTRVKHEYGIDVAIRDRLYQVLRKIL